MDTQKWLVYNGKAYFIWMDGIGWIDDDRCVSMLLG
jgi:hypothetical protein